LLILCIEALQGCCDGLKLGARLTLQRQQRGRQLAMMVTALLAPTLLTWSEG
jgi:hypothetical protein